jgi:hypothetical protein
VVRATSSYLLACLCTCSLFSQVFIAMTEPLWKQMEVQLERQGQEWPPKVARVLRVLANQGQMTPEQREWLLREAVDAELAN